MQHVMPHERPTPQELGPIARQRAALPALCWAAALVLIVLAGWVDAWRAEQPLQVAVAQKAAAAASAPR